MGYNYRFETVGSSVNFSFDLLDEKDGQVAYCFNYTSSFSETPKANSNGVFTFTLNNQVSGTVLTFACKFAFAGGLAVTKKFTYTVGDDCSSANKIATNELLQILMYPNPASSELTIDNLKSRTQILIYALNGNVLFNKMSSSFTEKINISELYNGFYFVKLMDNNQTRTAKFIKQ